MSDCVQPHKEPEEIAECECKDISNDKEKSSCKNSVRNRESDRLREEGACIIKCSKSGGKDCEKECTRSYAQYFTGTKNGFLGFGTAIFGGKKSRKAKKSKKSKSLKKGGKSRRSKK